MHNLNQNKGISTPAGTLIILVVILLAGGIIIWQVSRLAKEEVKPLEEKAPGEQVKDETANWKTYKNEEYGYEVKYPEDWELKKINENFWKIKKIGDKDILEKCVEDTNEKEETGHFCVFYFPSLKIYIEKTNFNNAEDYLADECKDLMQGIGACPSIIGEAVVDGIKGKLIKSCIEMASIQSRVVVKDNYVYKISRPDKCIDTFGPGYSENQQLVDFFNTRDAIYKDIFNQILSTFRFSPH